MLQVPVGEEETEMDKETEDPNKNKEFYCLFLILCLIIYFFQPSYIAEIMKEKYHVIEG